ncbi:tetratricopeptide repeat protein [Pseudahrensia aquimaris]|uniref:Tetratricopeptide repeat protein n=1 Tax=Pseudahrensia aquimaris TaxID=744461 RepID=A0ABW3FHS6_9HYPH
MSLRSIKTLSAAAIALSLVAPLPSFAAGGGGTTTTTPSCKKGKVWDKRNKKCVAAKKSSSLDNDNIYEVARGLAYEKRYDEAKFVLLQAQDQRDPRILNYLGFTTRKMGDIEGGLRYYQAALKIDPNYTLVREYMGEAYLQLGRVDMAREQLAEIEKRCGTDCAEYAMLEKEIARAVN